MDPSGESIDWRARLVELAPWGAASLLVTLVVLMLTARFGHPFDLEWMEGGMLAHAWRIDHGLPVYPPPNPDFVPFIYPPGYASVVALLGQLVGLSLPLGRAVSLVGLALATTAAAWTVWRHTGAAMPAMVAAAVWLGAFPGSGGFYDLVRPDALAMGMCAWSIALAAERTRGSALASGLLLAAAFACKHNMAAFGFPLLIGLWLRDGWGRALRFALASALPALALTVGLQLASDGNFLRYLLEVPASHPMYAGRMLPGLPRELGNALPVSAAAIGAWCALRPARHLSAGVAAALPVAGGIALATGVHLAGPLAGPLLHVPAALGGFGLGAALVGAGVGLADGAGRSWRWTWAVLLGATAVAVCAMMRAHHGGYLNVYMPLHWMVACGLGFVLADLRRAGWRALAAGVAVAELLFLTWALHPGRYVPTEADRVRGEILVAALAEVDGPVLSPMASWVPAQAGHPPSLHMISVWDLAMEGGPFEEEVQAIQEAIDTHYYGAVVEGSRPFTFEIDRAYEVRRTLPAYGEAMAPKTGFAVRPTRIRVPRE